MEEGKKKRPGGRAEAYGRRQGRRTVEWRKPGSGNSWVFTLGKELDGRAGNIGLFFFFIIIISLFFKRVKFSKLFSNFRNEKFFQRPGRPLEICGPSNFRPENLDVLSNFRRFG